MTPESMQRRGFHKRGILLLLLTCLLSLPAGGAQLSLDQAVARVRAETGGKVVSARTIQKGGRRLHQIRILTPNGRVKNINVDAQQGDRQRQRR